MPIYEYECRRCGHEFETIQKFSDKPLRKCPDCSRLSLRKKVSAAAFHLKGTGWYATDFRDKGGKSASKGGNGSEKKSETKSDSTSSTKPSSATETKAAAG